MLQKSYFGVPAPIIIGAAAFVAVLLFGNMFFIVPQTQQAMVVALGRVVREVPEPGLHVKAPFYHQVVYFDKRLLATESPAEEVQSLDKKRVVIDSFTRWQIANAGDFYRAVRTMPVATQRLNSIVNSNIRAVVASYPLLDLVGVDRQEAMALILTNTAREAAPLGIRVVDVRIKRTDLPPENSEAVFRRMRAEREKEAREIRATGEEESQKIRAQAEASRTIIVADAEKQSQILRGQGDAQAIAVTGRAFSKNPQFFELIKGLEAARAVINPSNTLILLDGANPVLDALTTQP